MDQTEKATSIQHPEEKEHPENGASKMFRKVKAKAKKFKNSLTKHGQSNEYDHDVVGDDDEDDVLEPEVISAPVRGDVTSQPESLSHPRETTVPASEKIVPPGNKVCPSSDYTKTIEPVPLQDTSYGHEPLSDPVRTTDISEKEEIRKAPTHHPFGVSEREESREAHHEALNTPVSLLTETEDVTTTFATGGDDEHLGGQRKVNVHTPKKFEEDPAIPGGGSDYLNGVSNYQSTVNDSTHQGGGEDGVTEITESLGSLKVSDESADQKFERDLPTRSHEVDRETESAIGKDAPVSSRAELQKDFSTRSHEFDTTTESGIDKDSSSRSYEFDLKTESGIDKNSLTGFSAELKTKLEEDFPMGSYESDQKTESGINKESPTSFNAKSAGFPTESHEFDQKTESVINKDSPTRFGGESKTELEKDSPTISYESDQKKESEINKNSTAGLCSGSIFGLGEDFPAKSHELGLKNESESGKDSPTGFGGESKTSLGEGFPAKESQRFGEESKAELEKTFPARSDDVKVETELGRDLPTESYDQFSPEVARTTKRDEFEESRDSFEETRYETQEPKQSTYTEQLPSATPAITNKAIAAKNAVASKLGFSGEIPKGDETKVAGTDDEKLTPINETGSTVTTELPLSGGASDLEEKQQKEVEKGVSAKNYLAEKLTPGEEDKALSEVIAEKLRLGGGEKKATMTKEVEVIPNEKESEEKEHGEEVTEEVKGGGGMVGMIKGWFGGVATEEVKPKSPHSVEESSQSLGSTVGTMGFPDSSGSELGETGGGTGAVPVQRGLGN